MIGFAHDGAFEVTTLTELQRVRGEISPDLFLGCYAYATQSGFRTFELGMGQDFWANTKSRWLFGIDYGRSDPRALKEIAGKTNTEVRVFDGRYVVDSTGFIPRRDYHAKVALLENSSMGAHGLVLGSGNFSYNGLWRSVEAGASLTTTNIPETEKRIDPVKAVFEEYWKNSCPLADIVTDYEGRLAEFISTKDAKRVEQPEVPANGFWIEAGYVTKNRGPDKPGNQIFAPNGFRKFFNLGKVKGSSTLIGEIKFSTRIGPNITKNYRENDNGMEKLTLPMPEEHGFGVYDGKVLLFQPTGDEFLLSAIELGEFELAYGHRLANVEKMGGGRRYGELK